LSSSLIEPRQLRKIRTQLGFTQGALAAAAGVSQSIIAKIEAGSVDPTYNTLAAISRALAAGGAEKGNRASDIMSSPVIGVHESTKLAECVEVMRKRGFSQIPVLSGRRMVGTISEGHIMSLVSASPDPRSVLGEKVGAHLLPSFPIVGRDTPVEALFSLFRFFPAVIVGSAEQPEGIVTKIDLLTAGAASGKRGSGPHESLS
jgi:predicted transcriptional regulator